MNTKIQFDINPHVVRQLGEELVSDEITALMEIVKNAYDADASYVSIEINANEKSFDTEINYKNHTGFITIEDDGFGMDEETILKSWLIISYSNKRKEKQLKKKTPKGRAPLGEKGLGRLSTQRLADICEIFSTKENANEQVHVAFNWKDFENTEKLGDVPVLFKKIQKKRVGTKIALLDIKNPEVWKGNNLEKFKGLISQMISPYDDNRPFEVYLKVNGQVIDLDKENLSLRDIATSRYEFNFDGDKLLIKGKIRPIRLIGNRRDEYNSLILHDQGKKFAQYLLKQKGTEGIRYLEGDRFFLVFEKEFSFSKDFPGLDILDGKLANPGSFFGEINEFSFDSTLKSDDIINSVFDKFSNYKEFAQRQVGIKLYRNGFAVKPFGLNGDDWLKLRDEQTSGSSYYALKPGNVIGYFAIDEYQNSNLKDKTDREGLVTNAYSTNFLMIASRIVGECNAVMEKVRRTYNDFVNASITENNKVKTIHQAVTVIKHAAASSQRTASMHADAKSQISKIKSESNLFISEIENSPLFSTDEEKKAAKKVKEIYSKIEVVESALTHLEPLINEAGKLNETIAIIEPRINHLEEQLFNFSSLAALGLTAESVSHEFSNIADKLGEKSDQISKRLDSGKLNEGEIYILLEYINSTVNGLKVQLRHLDPSLRYMRERKDIFLMSDFLISERDYYTDRLSKKGINFSLEILDDFEIKMNKGKLTQVLDNLITNSEYWLVDRLNKESDFKPSINVRIDKPWVYISDNGYGVTPAVQDNLFEPFVTMKPKEKGRGLGLFIVQQILDSEGCLINLEPDLNLHERKYIFSINFSNLID